jgi:hypothetical protein
LLTGGKFRRGFPGEGPGASIGVRGLPVDVSPEIREWHDLLAPDAFHASWLLLSEALAFPWEKTTVSPFDGGEITFAQAARPEFMDDVLGRLRTLYKDPSSVRLVFWFLP